MIENVISATENCRYCLMCRHVCPVSHVTRKETLSPHGWGLTIASLRRNLLELDDDSISTLYSCADCGTCRANCVTDQPLPSAIAAMRQEVVDQGLAPNGVKKLRDLFERWQNPYAEVEPQPPSRKGEIALFVGDDAHYLEEGSLTAVTGILEAVGLDPVYIGVGRSSGYLAASLGLHDTAASLIRLTMEELLSTGARLMLVLGPGDYYTFTQMCEERLGLSWPEDVEIKEVSVLLSDYLSEGFLSLEPIANSPPAAYVDPTHSVRVQNRFDAPRHLLSAIIPSPPLELFWRKDRSHPCGNVALQFTQPHISDHLTYARLADARQSGAQLLITDDPGTLHHMRRHAPRFGLQVQSLYKMAFEQLNMGR